MDYHAYHAGSGSAAAAAAYSSYANASSGFGKIPGGCEPGGSMVGINSKSRHTPYPPRAPLFTAAAMHGLRGLQNVMTMPMQSSSADYHYQPHLYQHPGIAITDHFT